VNHRHIAEQFRGISLIAEKDMRIYYTKPPVLMFGFLFPTFIFLAFFFGRGADIYTLFPGLSAMFVFFIASSVGPLITPWEKRAGTYERLLSFPVTVNTIILGDVAAGMLYGIIIASLVLTVGAIALAYALTTGAAVFIVVSLLAGAFCFASLGALLASPASTVPANVMMLSNLVRFPLIFISGIFVPIDSVHGVGRIVSYCSPLTYLVDGFNWGLRGSSTLSPLVDLGALVAFTAAFLLLASTFHRRNVMKGL